MPRYSDTAKRFIVQTPTIDVASAGISAADAAVGPNSSVLCSVLPSAKCATRNAQPVGLCRAATPSIVIRSPGLKDAALKPLRESTVRDASSQVQVCFAPDASTTSM